MTSEINNSNAVSVVKEIAQEPMITGRDSEILFEKNDQTPLVKQSSLNGDEEEI